MLVLRYEITHAGYFALDRDDLGTLRLFGDRVRWMDKGNTDGMFQPGEHGGNAFLANDIEGANRLASFPSLAASNAFQFPSCAKKPTGRVRKKTYRVTRGKIT